MITRENIKQYILQIKQKEGDETISNRWQPDILVELIDQIYDSFEEAMKAKDEEIERMKAIIEEAMKPKTCEGCVYGVFGVDSFGLEIECTLAYRCSRGKDDMFKPKDNK